MKLYIILKEVIATSSKISYAVQGRKRRKNFEFVADEDETIWLVWGCSRSIER